MKCDDSGIQVLNDDFADIPYGKVRLSASNELATAFDSWHVRE